MSRKHPKHREPVRGSNPAGKVAVSAPTLSAKPAGVISGSPSQTVVGSAQSGRWRSVREFCGLDPRTTYLWSRWLVLRAVGVVYLFVFAGIIVEAQAMISPTGIAPIGPFLTEIRQLFPGTIAAWLAAPSLFWLNSGSGMIATLAWVGLAAALGVVLNLWPRLTLTACWGIFVSFVATWADFSSAQLDRLMLETALLCIPFAPSGFRPGLGLHSPPRPIAVFMMRWLLFRVMFESGVVKLVSSDPHWRNWTAMDVMYETAPSPTILGYWAHQLPHAVHVAQVAFTFVAELVAPIVAVFGGRRGRWFAFCVWTAFQVGIQATCNFGWLNTAALGLGFLLLDDQMLAGAANRLRRTGFNRWLVATTTYEHVRPLAAWRRHGLRLALGFHFALTLFYFARIVGLPVDGAPAMIAGPVQAAAGFCSANGYSLYENFARAHTQVDFEGSNDRGQTWRSYEFRHVPQQVDRVAAFLAPWYPRFEATIQIESWTPGQFTVLPLVATQLLARNPDVINRFRGDPFADRPPNVVRMRRYRMAFTEPAVQRHTGRYWRKEYDGDFAPAIYVTGNGTMAQFDLTEADAALKAEDYATAFRLCDEQYQLGNLDAGYRLADMYSRGLGVAERPEKTFALFTDLAARGELRAQHNLGLCYEHGVGVEVDYAKAAEMYRISASRGSLLSIFALGRLSAEDQLSPTHDVEGLAMLLKAGRFPFGDAALRARIQNEQPAMVERLMNRMSPANIARAQTLASQDD